MFWNALLLPLITVFNLAAAVLIRRYFGLESGLYDALLGVLNTLLAYTAFGIPSCFPQFLPGLEMAGDRSPVWAFIRRAGSVRLGLLALALVPFNLLAEPLAGRLSLGPQGPALLHMLSVLVILRAANDLAVKSLQALLAHLWANLLLFLQALLVAAALVFTFAQGLGMQELVTALTVVAAVVLAVGTTMVARGVRSVAVHRPRPAGAAEQPDPTRLSARRVGGFAAFMYLFELANYFALPAFASTALMAATGDMGQVALFNVGFQFPIMVVVVMLAGFQGLYRPMFAGLFSQGDLHRVCTAFREVSKVQAVLLLPAGAGLAIMVGDYVPLLFGPQFAPAVPVARILCVFLFTESLFNLGSIMLSVDHRYAPVLAAQSLRILAAPIFVWVAANGQLLLATTVFGAGRLMAALIGYLIARRRYGIRFPLGFVARVAGLAFFMAVVVGAARYPFQPSWAEAAAVTVLGAALVVAGFRWLRILGRREIELLERAQLPGGSLIIGWLTPRS